MEKLVRRCILALLAVAVMACLDPTEAAAFCNPTHQAWDPCYDPDVAKQPEQQTGKSLPPADCEDLDLKVAQPAVRMTCKAASISGDDARARAEIVVVDMAGGFMAVQYINAGVRTYIGRTTPTAVAEDAGLRTIGGARGAQFRLQDFDVRHFAQTGGSECVAFAKHWGHVPQSPGYRYRITGVYCAGNPSDLEEANLDRVLAGIEPGG